MIFSCQMYFIVMTSNVIRFLCLKVKIKLKFSRICLLYLHLILKPVERPVLTGFLNFKISKRPRPLCLGPHKDQDHGLVFIQFSPVWSPVFYRSLRLDLETLVIVHRSRRHRKQKTTLSLRVQTQFKFSNSDMT